jgi:hypothetical protein
MGEEPESRLPIEVQYSARPSAAISSLLLASNRSHTPHAYTQSARTGFFQA